jgi:hypothetical protein
MKRWSILLAAAAALAPLLTAGPARAQMVHVPGSDWRQTDRHDALLAAQAKQLFTFELRFGAYMPNIDSDPAFAGIKAEQRPFAKVFGQQCSQVSMGAASTTATCNPGSVAPMFYFGFEVDVLPLRIPYVGILGAGLGWSFTTISAIANYSNSEAVTDPNKKGMPSGESTSLFIMPMHVSVVLRADELMRRTGIPLVPYGKLGVGYNYWKASTDTGLDQYSKGSKQFNGQGFTPAMHFALGGMLALNFLEPRAAATLDETTGVHHAYVFGEYFNDRLEFAPARSLHIGASTFAVGLAADM